MSEINYPKIVTYFIVKNDNHMGCGVVNPDQCMATGSKDLETFIDQDLWVGRLKVLHLILTRLAGKK